MDGFGLHTSQIKHAIESEKNMQKAAEETQREDFLEGPVSIRLPSGKVVHHQGIDKTNMLMAGVQAKSIHGSAINESVVHWCSIFLLLVSFSLSLLHSH
jgi:hypothetical protein